MKVRTIKGDVSPDSLGYTYTHEHLVCFPPSVTMKEDPDFQLPSVPKAIDELRRFSEAGGRTLVEGTAIDYGRNVRLLREVADATPVNVVITSGFNKSRFYPEWVVKASVEELADLMVKEVTEGIDGTSMKAGQLKCGSWYNVITPQEEKVTRAVALAHKQTGAPVWVHTEVGTMGLEQLDILEEEGTDLSKVVLGHSDRNADPWYHRKIAERGAIVGFDGPSKVKYYPDSVRVDCIKRLLDAGHIERLTISGDMGRQSYLTSYGGGPGFQFILKQFIPRLLDEGLTQVEIEQIWVKNPARWLAF